MCLVKTKYSTSKNISYLFFSLAFTTFKTYLQHKKKIILMPLKPKSKPPGTFDPTCGVLKT